MMLTVEVLRRGVLALDDYTSSVDFTSKQIEREKFHRVKAYC